MSTNSHMQLFVLYKPSRFGWSATRRSISYFLLPHPMRLLGAAAVP